MITISPPPYRKSKRIKFPPPVAPPPVALVLVEAVYPFQTLEVLRLRFDRAINIAELDGTQIIVNDGFIEGQLCEATGPATLLDARTLRVGVVAIPGPIMPNLLLTATGASGIVAVDDGGAWAGVTNLQLPFP